MNTKYVDTDYMVSKGSDGSRAEKIRVEEEPGAHCRDEYRQIIGCAMEVLNTLGHGLLEKPYEQALTVEFRLNRIPFAQQPRYGVWYKGHSVGCFIPDFVVYDQIVVDTKVVDQLGNAERGQMINYLRITDLKMGLLLNFRRPRLEWRRIRL